MGTYQKRRTTRLGWKMLRVLERLVCERGPVAGTRRVDVACTFCINLVGGLLMLGILLGGHLLGL